MSKIDELIEELCPEGVSFTQLKDVAAIGTGRSDKKDSDTEGPYPFFVRSKQVYQSQTFEFDETAILIPGEGGIGEIFHFHRGPYALHQRAYRVAPNSEQIEPKFLFYFMIANFKHHILARAVSATVTSIRKPMIESFPVALPPLEVQIEIVSILDKFTQLEAELEAELEARRIQYEVTRDRLLDFSGALEEHPMSKLIREVSPQSVEYKTLGELLESIPRGKRLTKAELPENGTFPVFHGGLEPIGFTDQANTEAMTVMVINVGASAGSVGWSEEPFWCSDGCFALPHAGAVMPKYLYYCALANQRFFVERVRRAGIPTLAPASVLTLSIPVPPLEIQSEIVSILDKLDALVNNITIGLPGEIAARRKQYEYYRNKLLTFKELEAA